MRKNKQSLINFGFEKIANDPFISGDLSSWNFLSFRIDKTDNIQIGIYFKISENKDIYDINAFMRRHNIKKLLTGNDNYISAVNEIDKDIAAEFHWSYQERIFIPLKVLGAEEYRYIKNSAFPTDKDENAEYMPIKKIDKSFEGREIIAMIKIGEQPIPVPIKIKSVDDVWSDCSLGGACFKLLNKPDDTLNIFTDIEHYNNYLSSISQDQ